jgi:hypothetical protein
MDEHTEFAAPSHDLGHRLEGADLVVAPLEVHE